MTVQISYKNTKTKNNTNNIVLFVDENFNIFPNPTEGILTVTPVFLEEEIPMVFNILGENLSNKITLKRLSENTIQLNIENLPKGAYFLKHKNQVLKFIKN